jgi:hypothetical protein
MQLENTRYTRQHTDAEEKAQGFKEVRTTHDIWMRKRGTDDQIASLFVAMARAAGFKAYLGAVTNRQQSIFLQSYLSLSQLNDSIAIVNLDGTDQFFDPGARFCPYGHLSWQHSVTQGIRQTEGGGDFVVTPAEPYTFSRVTRIADLQGALTGNLTMTYTGDPALDWRHRSIEGDSASLEREIRASVEQQMPNGVEVKVVSIDKLQDYEQPLIAKLEVKGALGSSTGKRVLLAGDIFQANIKPTFTHEKRLVPVYFEYTRILQDVVRVKFLSTFTIESLPAADKSLYKQVIAYSMSSEATPTSFTIRRNYTLGAIVFPLTEYSDIRAFYSKFENKDQESVVLTTASASAKTTPPGN